MNQNELEAQIRNLRTENVQLAQANRLLLEENARMQQQLDRQDETIRWLTKKLFETQLQLEEK